MVTHALSRKHLTFNM